MGNASHFRCSYHGWTFKNTGDLIGVPYHREVYRGQLDRAEWGLRPVRIDTYGGLIFGTLDPNADPLDEYLGGFQFYLDFFLKPGPEGVEVYGPPERWVSDTDWKICAENFGGDGYHTPVAHQFGFALGFYPSSGRTHFMGYAVHIPGRGHCIGIGHTPGLPPFVGFPPEVVEGVPAGPHAGADQRVPGRPDVRRDRLPEPLVPHPAVQPGAGSTGTEVLHHAALAPAWARQDRDVDVVPGAEAHFA